MSDMLDIEVPSLSVGVREIYNVRTRVYVHGAYPSTAHRSSPRQRTSGSQLEVFPHDRGVAFDAHHADNLAGKELTLRVEALRAPDGTGEPDLPGLAGDGFKHMTGLALERLLGRIEDGILLHPAAKPGSEEEQQADGEDGKGDHFHGDGDAEKGDPGRAQCRQREHEQREVPHCQLGRAERQCCNQPN